MSADILSNGSSRWLRAIGDGSWGCAMRSHGYVIAVALLALVPGLASGAPAVVSGWPVVSGVGAVLPGPGGGPVVVNEGYGVAAGSPSSSVAAFRLDGRRRWISSFVWGCGNCIDAGPRAQLQADGRYGPIGPEGSGTWSITRTGSRRSGCIGAVLPDGTCIVHEIGFTLPSFTEYPAIVARRGSTLVWEYARPNLSWTIGQSIDAPPEVIRDRTGVLYTTLGAGSEPSGTPVPTRLIALNEVTGGLLWEAPDAVPLATLASGVIVRRPGVGLIRYSAEGAVIWTNPTWKNFRGLITVDQARQHVYVSAGGSSTNRYIAALDSESGAERWRTASRDGARVLSVGTNGIVYVAVSPGERPALRAVGPEGRGRWQWETTMPVSGALRLPDGTVAASTGSVAPGDIQAGLLWRIDPRRTSRPADLIRLSLTRTVFTPDCVAPGCQYRRDLGTGLRIATPSRITLEIRLLLPSGRAATRRLASVPAPAGVSFVRLFAGDTGGQRGRRLVEIRCVRQGRTAILARVPVTIR